MSGSINWDVLVIGAGPAGSSAALAAVNQGASVLMVERKETIGTPVQCAEFLPRRVLVDLSMPPEAVAQTVERTLTFVNGVITSERRNPGVILNRDVFDRVLANSAVEGGAILRTRMNATGLERTDDGKVAVELENRGKNNDVTRVTAKVVIGADGPRSIVGAFMGRENTHTLVGHQRTVQLSGPIEHTEVYLEPEYVGGYAWLFPKGDIANVGVGVDTAMGGNPREALEHFVASLGDRIGRSRSKTGGLIPVGGPHDCVLGSLMLVGDSAGHTNPITGGGNHQAVLTGQMAGKAAADFVSGDEDALADYERRWRSLFEFVLQRATRRRQELMAGWADAVKNPMAFDDLMRRTWIGFNEFYKKRGEGN